MIPAAWKPNRFVALLAPALAAAMAAALLVEGWSARAVQEDDIATALALRPHSVPALTRGATDAFGARRFDASRALARAALGQSPLNVAAMRTLGFVADHQGKLKRAAALMNQSARLSWRDTPTQAWLFQQALLNNDTAAIAQRGDALLRRDQMQDSVYAAFGYLIQSDDGRAFLAQTLAYHPDWRTPFLRQLDFTTPKAAAEIIALFDTMKMNGDTPDASETTPFLVRLIDAGYALDAAKLTRRLNGRKAAAALLDDPDFTKAASGFNTPPFTWKIQVMTGAQPLPGTAPDGSPALAVQEDGSGADGFVTRYLGLPPGRYRLHLRVYSDSADALDRLRAQIQCLAPRSALATVKPATTAGKWIDMSDTFEVTRDCGAERIVLSLLGGGMSSDMLYLRGAAIMPVH